jgi:hypothetical protein
MTTLGRREKCLRNRSGKGHLRALRAHQMRNRPLPAPLETPWTQNRPNPCRGRPFGVCGELESESQNGNPGLEDFTFILMRAAEFRRSNLEVPPHPCWISCARAAR